MATYLQGVQGYIPQIQPFQPDLNFYAGALQTKQTQYDTAYKQISNLYGSLLNSPMVREGNIQKRDELFNIINHDIKRISGLDLSMPENVFAAQQVFQPIIDDQNIIKDITWTKNYQKAVTRGESFKTCTDVEKCGGQYWDTGMKDLQYQLEDFKNATDEEALGFGNAEFIPYINVGEKAVKLAKDAGLNVTQDIITGQWIFTQKNGTLLAQGLQDLFTEILGNDPMIDRMFNTEARVFRRDAVGSLINEGMNPDEAEMMYLNSAINNVIPQVNQQKEQSESNLNLLIEKRNDIQEKLNRDGFITNEEQSILNSIEQQIPAVENTSNNLNTLINTAKIQDNSIKAMRAKADAMLAYRLKYQKFENAAAILAQKDASLTVKENPYALAQFTSDLSLRNTMIAERTKQDNALQKLKLEAKIDMANDVIQYNLETGAYDDMPMKDLLTVFDGLIDNSVMQGANGVVYPGGQQQANALGESSPLMDMKVGNSPVPTVTTDDAAATSRSKEALSDAILPRTTYEKTRDEISNRKVNVKNDTVRFLANLYNKVKDGKTEMDRRILRQVFDRDQTSTGLVDKTNFKDWTKGGGTPVLGSRRTSRKASFLEAWGLASGSRNLKDFGKYYLLDELQKSSDPESVLKQYDVATLNAKFKSAKGVLKSHSNYYDDHFSEWYQNNYGTIQDIDNSYKAYDAIAIKNRENKDIAFKSVKEGEKIKLEGVPSGTSTDARDYVDIMHDSKGQYTLSSKEFTKKYFEKNKMQLLEDATNKVDLAKYNVEGWFDRTLYRAARGVTSFIPFAGNVAEYAKDSYRESFDKYKKVGYDKLSSGDKLNMDKLFAIAHQDAGEYSNAIYNELYDRMAATYAKLPGAAIDQGYFLEAGDNYHGNVLHYSGLDPYRKQNNVVGQAKQDLKELRLKPGFGTGEGAVQIVLGDPLTKDKEDQLAPFMQAKFAAALNKIDGAISKNYNKQAARPLFNYEIYTIADQNYDKSARTYTITDPDFIKNQLVGTKNKPGDLWEMKDELAANGWKFSVIYNREDQPLSSDSKFKISDEALIAQYNPEGYTFNIPNGGSMVIKKQADGTYNITSKLYTRHYRLNDPKGENNPKGENIDTYNISSYTDLPEAIARIKVQMQIQQQANLTVDQGAREAFLQGYDVNGFTK